MMKVDAIVDDIIGSVEPENIPLVYVINVVTIDRRGNEKILVGDDLKTFMDNPKLHELSGANVRLDTRKMKQALYVEMNAFFQNVSKLVGDTPST